jgi:hypothetical protein
MWTDNIRVNPLPALLGTDDRALLFFIERDLLGNHDGNIEFLWGLPEAQKTFHLQLPDGSWLYKGNRPGDELGEAYELLETWKTLRKLVEIYGLNHSHQTIKKACEFILSYQNEEGDIRGILSNQYMPYYMGAMLEILIKAGYENDIRVEKGIQWLLKLRQDDGGWISPLLLFKMSDYYKICTQPPVQPQKHLPFSHMVSGMVIRAFAAHPQYKKSSEAIQAGQLLKSRFFKKDAYTSRQAETYWFKFQFPFWWTNVLTVMDSLMRLNFSAQDENLRKGLNWLVDNQGQDGLWRADYGKKGVINSDYWVTLAICRILKHFLT